MSQRDVPGMTKSVIPHLRDMGVIGISIGVNDASMPAEIPKISRWRFDEPGYPTSEILLAYHPRGYGGYSKSECVEVMLNELNLLKVLCYDIRGDNAGPPERVDEVKGVFASIAKEYPGATIISRGGFDPFFEAVAGSKSAMSSLKVITQEIGDTWIYGVPSEPFKTAAFRAWQSVFERFNTPTGDAKFYNFSRQFLKNAEHTWGGDVKTFLDASHAPEYFYWSNADFEAHRSGDKMSQLELTWVEQRQWGFDHPLEALGEEHPFTAIFQAMLKDTVEASLIPDLSSFSTIEPADLVGRRFTFSGKLSQFDIALDSKTGAINSFVAESSPSDWAGVNNTLGEVWYQTYTENDVQEYLKEYLTCTDCEWALLDFGKKGVSKANPKRQDILGSLVQVHTDPNSEDIWTELSFPADANQLFGAPKSIFIKYSLDDNDQLAMQVVWKDKTPTRLPESISVRFNPLHVSDEYLALDKLGFDVSIKYDGSSVVKNGSQHLHGVNSGVKFVHPSAGQALQVQTLDAPVVCLGQPTPFPTVVGTTESKSTLLPDYQAGLSFNLLNNIWGTNYVMWYPFKDEGSSMGQTGVGSTQGFRFKLGVVHQHENAIRIVE
jgi:hypothetical protein